MASLKRPCHKVTVLPCLYSGLYSIKVPSTANKSFRLRYCMKLSNLEKTDLSILTFHTSNAT